MAAGTPRREETRKNQSKSSNETTISWNENIFAHEVSNSFYNLSPSKICQENSLQVAPRMECRMPSVMPYPNHGFWMPIVQPMAFIPPPTPFVLFPNMLTTAQMGVRADITPPVEVMGGWFENQKLANIAPNHSTTGNSQGVPFASPLMEDKGGRNDTEPDPLFRLFGWDQQL
jgi:hypothetical protein